MNVSYKFSYRQHISCAIFFNAHTILSASFIFSFSLLLGVPFCFAIAIVLGTNYFQPISQRKAYEKRKKSKEKYKTVHLFSISRSRCRLHINPIVAKNENSRLSTEQTCVMGNGFFSSVFFVLWKMIFTMDLTFREKGNGR